MAHGKNLKRRKPNLLPNLLNIPKDVILFKIFRFILSYDCISSVFFYRTLYNFSLTCKSANQLVNEVPYFLNIRENHQSKFFSGKNTKPTDDIEKYLRKKGLLKPIPHLITLITTPELKITPQEDDLISFTLKLLEHTYPLQYQLLHTLNEKGKKNNITYRHKIIRAIKADEKFQELRKDYVINLLLKIFERQECIKILLDLFYNTNFSNKNDAKSNLQKAIVKLIKSIPVDNFPEAIKLLSKYQHGPKLCYYLIHRLNSKNLFEKIKLFPKIHTKPFGEQIHNLIRRTKYDERITITKMAISRLNNDQSKITKIAAIIAYIAIQFLQPKDLGEILNIFAPLESINISKIKIKINSLLNQYYSREQTKQKLKLLQSDRNYNVKILFDYLVNNLQNKDNWIVKISINALTRLATLNKPLIPKIWNLLFPLSRKKLFDISNFAKKVGPFMTTELATQILNLLKQKYINLGTEATYILLQRSNYKRTAEIYKLTNSMLTSNFCATPIRYLIQYAPDIENCNLHKIKDLIFPPELYAPNTKCFITTHDKKTNTPTSTRTVANNYKNYYYNGVLSALVTAILKTLKTLENCNDIFDKLDSLFSQIFSSQVIKDYEARNICSTINRQISNYAYKNRNYKKQDVLKTTAILNSNLSLTCDIKSTLSKEFPFIAEQIKHEELSAFMQSIVNIIKNNLSQTGILDDQNLLGLFRNMFKTLAILAKNFPEKIPDLLEQFFTILCGCKNSTIQFAIIEHVIIMAEFLATNGHSDNLKMVFAWINNIKGCYLIPSDPKIVKLNLDNTSLDKIYIKLFNVFAKNEKSIFLSEFLDIVRFYLKNIRSEMIVYKHYPWGMKFICTHPLYECLLVLAKQKPEALSQNLDLIDLLLNKYFCTESKKLAIELIGYLENYIDSPKAVEFFKKLKPLLSTKHQFKTEHTVDLPYPYPNLKSSKTKHLLYTSIYRLKLFHSTLSWDHDNLNNNSHNKPRFTS
jgi:hypothetical protein